MKTSANGHLRLSDEDIAETLLASVAGLEMGEMVGGLVFALKVLIDQHEDPDHAYRQVLRLLDEG